MQSRWNTGYTDDAGWAVRVRPDGPALLAALRGAVAFTAWSAVRRAAFARARSTRDRIAMRNLRSRVLRLVERPAFQNAVMGLIAVNAVTLGLETSPSMTAVFGSGLHLFDQIVVGVFCVEILLRLYAHRGAFFRDPWSVFDLVVVAVTLAPANESFAVLRALRVLRVLRLVSAVPRLRRVVAALLRAVPGVASVSALLLLVFYVFGVITTKLFGGAFPDWFGTVGASMYSLFQIMTLESWSMGIVRPVMEVYPWAWAVFVIFIVLSSFTVLNLFIAIMIDSMQSLHEEEQQRLAEETGKAVHREFLMHADDYERLRREIEEIRKLLEERRR